MDCGVLEAKEGEIGMFLEAMGSEDLLTAQCNDEDIITVHAVLEWGFRLYRREGRYI